MRGTLVIGYGAIGRAVVARLREDPGAAPSHLLVRPARVSAVQAEVGDEIRVVATIDALAPLPAFALECAGHEAIGDYGTDLLRRGVDLGIVSTGALADADLMAGLEQAAREGGARIEIVPGAVGGMDALAAARVEGLESVEYVSAKPPSSWRGTPAEAAHDLDRITEPTTLYAGTAREAARLYPKNANVAATIALAGLGFEATRVTLIADPAARGNTHRVDARGAFGELSMTLVGHPLPDNPKSSALTAMSAVRAIRNRAGRLSI